MPSGSPTVIVAGACFLLAAVAHARYWRFASWVAAGGAAILAGALAARGLRAGFWPLATRYEFALVFALTTTLGTLAAPTSPPSRASRSLSKALAVAMFIATLLVTYARFVLPETQRAIRPLPPALDSVWFPLHVGAAALAYGVLALAGATGLACLLQDLSSPAAAPLPEAASPEIAKGSTATSPRDGYLQSGRSAVGIPSAEKPGPAGTQDATWLLDRAIATGFPLLTLSLIFGMIWAQVAWGRYWDWDLKETWTLITWLVYAIYWHVRRRPHWQGSLLAWLALAGLAAILLTFLGTGWLAREVGMQSLHLFSQAMERALAALLPGAGCV